MNRDHDLIPRFRDDGILEIHWARADRQNRFDLSMLHQLRRILVDEVDKKTCAVLMTHEGEAFCLGGLLGDPRKQDAGSVHTFAAALSDALMSIATCPVPVVAALEGNAEGGGVSIIEMCDMVAASENASFAIPEMLTDMPPVVSFTGAAAVIPEKRLLEMAYLGRSITAREAEHYGLITKTVQPGKALLQCEDWLRTMRNRNPAAIQTIRLLRQRVTLPEMRRRIEAAADLLVFAQMHEETWAMRERKEGKEP